MKKSFLNQYAGLAKALVIASMLSPLLSFGQAQTLSLQKAIELAQGRNRDLRIDSINIHKAKQQTAITRGLLMPNISLTGQFQHYFQKPVFFGLNGNTSNSEKIGYGRFGGEDIGAAQISLVQPIYNSGAKHEIERRKLLEKQSQLSFRQREVDVVAQVKQNYVQLLVLNERLKLQKESIVRNQKALNDSRSLLAQGRALRVDTLRAYTSVKNLEPDVLRLTYALQISQQQLRNLLGDVSETDYLLSDSLELNANESVPGEDGTYKLSIQQRPDLQILSLNKEINDKEIELYKSARLPVVSFISQYQIQTQTNQFRFGNAAYPPVFYTGVQFAIPIFSGNQNINKIALGKIERQQADVIYNNAQEQLKTEVKQVLASLIETSERIKTQQNVSETAELSYSITKYRYEKGVASRLELIDSEFALTSAKSNYLEAVYDYLSSKIELDRITGNVKDQL
ncbi:TolC family protein [Dyadobacter psychrophilus]|uniref:Outer membrane protein TolC n=1 Tax=Dyadobacter psychrophilus TaxID=651661 RepID=A0A1T5CNZ9_9BACT|nr:TolC family protein [Dyadobacter psychrophilus]SKB61228.1 Outer membrane protein TolC [Dyadobacter psychrophilus]